MPQISSYVLLEKDFFVQLANNRRSPSKIREQLAKADDKQLLALAEVVLNTLHGRFSLTTAQKEKLGPYASLLRGLAASRSTKSARGFVQQGGAVWGVLASIALPLILDYLRK